ncbi:MAG: ABC transporter ATP-binding protein [Myxococcales bacterium]|nr:ABC transporter ATP-binding protein [Myxococcota bacterium]MDW8280555.1 ABC transporter ATP-binding protein [Myxococcales bacterium]
MSAVLKVEDLAKTFILWEKGLVRKKIRAVESVSFSVEKNEIFGFVGPNGAGKTTTIKMLMGLIFPSAGTIEILGRRLIGHKTVDIEAKRVIGFLPENPYFYDYLTGRELLDFVGRLFGIPGPERQRRIHDLLDLVGLGRAGNLALRKYSKGMLQRIGIAQALINNPELVILDEPMSGLDPIGRKEIRDLIVQLRDQGKTVFFSTHILSDVELICNRVAIVVGGKLRDVGPLDKLLSPRLLHTEVVLETAGERREHRLPPTEDVDAFLLRALSEGHKVISVTPRRESIEDLFVREVEQSDTGMGAQHKLGREARP